MNRITLITLILACASLTAGCPSMTTMGTARTLDAGETQFFVAPEYSRFSLGGEPLSEPTVEIGGRYGITDDVEVGARVWLPGYAIDTKIALLRSESEETGWDISVAPALSYLGSMSGTAEGSGYELHVTTLYLPLLMGYNLGGGNSVVLGARIADQIWTTEDQADTTANLLYVGGSLSFVWKVADGIRIAPEVALAAPIVESVPGFGTDVGIGATLFQAGIAFLFGG